MDQGIRRKLKQWLDEHFDEMVRDISALVAVPSVAQRQDDEEAPFGSPCRRALEEMHLAEADCRVTRSRRYFRFPARS